MEAGEALETRRPVACLSAVRLHSGRRGCNSVVANTIRPGRRTNFRTRVSPWQETRIGNGTFAIGDEVIHNFTPQVECRQDIACLVKASGELLQEGRTLASLCSDPRGSSVPRGRVRHVSKWVLM